MWKLILIVFLNQAVEMHEVHSFSSFDECHRQAPQLVNHSMVPEGAKKLIISCVDVDYQ